MNREAAFPRPASEAHQHGMHSPQEGMSLRDYFAAKALQSIIDGTGVNVGPNIEDDDMYDAKRAYEYADAMMKARKYE